MIIQCEDECFFCVGGWVDCYMESNVEGWKRCRIKDVDVVLVVLICI